MDIPSLLLPDPATLHLDDIQIDDANHAITMHVVATTDHAWCPTCGAQTSRVHSRYTRTLADLPWADWAVHIQITVRKFRCLEDRCACHIFTERIPSIAAPWARRTGRLAATHRAIGLIAGGRPGEALADTLHMPIHGDVLLALLRRTPLPVPPQPRVLGVDDWAQRKAHTYGTILVDHERQQPIDLLPDRQADTLAQWLRAHPGVTIITRDRGGSYAEGARAGAPNAIQVADRWHLLKNVGDALLQVFQQQHQLLEGILTSVVPVAIDRVAMPPASEASADADHPPPPVVPGVLPPSRRVQNQHARATAKAARHAHVCALHQQGWSLRAIAAATGLDRRTVRTYTQLPAIPADRRGPRPSLLDPYKAYLIARWNAGCRNAMRLLEEIQLQGYAGQRSILRQYFTSLRKAQGLAPRSRSILPGATAVEPVRKAPTLRTLVWAVLRQPAKRTAEETTWVAQIRTAHPWVECAMGLAEDFAVLVRKRQPEQLEGWLERAQQSGVHAFVNLAKSVRQDEAAVRAALTLPWSNGPVEGHINRLKTLKRQAYGRAKLDLLRIRLLAS